MAGITTRGVRHNIENSTLYMLSNYSLSNNKQPLTCITAAECGINPKHGVLSVISELNVK